MKKLPLLFIALAVLICYSGCKKEDNNEPSPAEASYDVYMYDPGYFTGDDRNMLQATVRKDGFQLSTFGNIANATVLGTVDKAYVYNKAESSESFMLFDDLGEPAFSYQIDLVTGEKKESVIEFERIDAGSFYVRLFHYDWRNRLGTLLFESVISGSNGNYLSTPTFEIENFGTGGGKSGSVEKGNTSFPVKLKRFDRMMSPNYVRPGLKGTDDGIGDWINSFSKMRNSTIADWLSTTRKAGAALTLTGLGLSETIIGAPAGVYLLAGGATLIAGSTAIEAVVTDKWSNFLNETRTQLESLSETATVIGDNAVSKFTGYGQNLKDHWENSSLTFTTIDQLIAEIETNEIIVTGEDLNDLPDTDGVLQIGLSWDTDATDVDLWVTDPAGEVIYYANPTSSSGGYLDRDDTDGFGPENIYWVDNIPDGDYKVQVHYFAGQAVTNYEVKVTNGLGYSASYTGILNVEDQLDDVVTFRKTGNQITK